jgi:hypothetical protein
MAFPGHKRVIVAAHTQKEAATLIGVSLNHFREYAAETGNEIERGVAINKPLTVFWADSREYRAPYTEMP